MKRIILLLTGLLILQSCHSDSAHTDTTAKEPTMSTSFNKMLDEYNEDRLKLFPLDATSLGDNRYNDQLPNDISQGYKKQLHSFYEHYQNRLSKFDRSTLNDNDKVSYDILKWECNLGLEKLKFKTELLPINQFASLNLTIGQFAGGSSAQPFKTVKDYDNWLSRLDAYVEWCDTAIANMRKGIKTGYVLPKTLTEKIIPQMKALAKGPVNEHLFYTPVKNLPDDFSDADKARLTNAYSMMIQNKIIPEYEKLYTFFKDEYLPESRNTSGISAIPNGREFYNLEIKEYTTTNMTADEIYDLGLKEVDRITAELEKVKNEVGYKGDLKSFFEYVRHKPELMPYTEPQQVLDHFKQIHDTIEAHLDTLFDKKPKTPFEIRRTEAFREASASAEYMPGSADGSRPGIFYVPIPDVRHYNVFADEDLFLHEAIPGHHYQISLQQENKDLPAFRQNLWYSSYGEGWALYCESLGKNLGLYKDPYQYFGNLSEEMHRAIRLVVDVAIHTKGWTREKAIQYSLDHEAESREAITAEIERYMAWPGQALSYKIGQLTILSLREKARQELGDQFDIRKFHDQVLESGCLPLEVLKTKLNSWIQSQKTSNPGS